MDKYNLGNRRCNMKKQKCISPPNEPLVLCTKQEPVKRGIRPVWKNGIEFLFFRVFHTDGVFSLLFIYGNHASQ